MEQTILRRRAEVNFKGALRVDFTSQALEQATVDPVAPSRASQFHGWLPVIDRGCGIGGDTLAMARVTPVMIVEADRSRLGSLMARAPAIDFRVRSGPSRRTFLPRLGGFLAGRPCFSTPLVGV